MAETIPIRPTAPGRDNRADTPEAPDDLTEERQELWREIVSTWVLDAPDFAQLHANLQQLDAYHRYMTQLQNEGATVTNPESGVIRAHPVAGLARDALREFRLGMRALGLAPPTEAT